MVKDYAKKVKTVFLLLVGKMFTYFPENPIKKKLRALLIALTNMAPNEFVIQNGDTVVLVGAPPGGEYIRMA